MCVSQRTQLSCCCPFHICGRKCLSDCTIRESTVPVRSVTLVLQKPVFLSAWTSNTHFFTIHIPHFITIYKIETSYKCTQPYIQCSNLAHYIIVTRFLKANKLCAIWNTQAYHLSSSYTCNYMDCTGILPQIYSIIDQ